MGNQKTDVKKNTYIQHLTKIKKHDFLIKKKSLQNF